MNKPSAWRRYKVRAIWLSALYALFLLSAVYGFRHHLFVGTAAYVVAILPALPIIGMFASIGRYLVEEQDEFQRMLMVHQSLWASGFALSLATLWGFLESFDLAGHIDAYYIVVAWFGGLGLGACINRATLGAGGRCR